MSEFFTKDRLPMTLWVLCWAAIAIDSALHLNISNVLEWTATWCGITALVLWAHNTRQRRMAPPAS